MIPGAVGEAMEIQHAPGQHVDPKDPDAVWVESLRSRTGVIAHRQKAIDRMKAVADKHNLTISWQDHKMKYDNFVKLLKKTKVFLSPFGLGEFSGKDYEAIMSGAVVVKPLASKIRSFPNIYEPHYMLEVDKDFSNLEEAVMPILNNVDSLRHNGQRMVDRGQQHLKNYGVGRFAQQLDHVLETIVLDPRMASSIRTS